MCINHIDGSDFMMYTWVKLNILPKSSRTNTSIYFSHMFFSICILLLCVLNSNSTPFRFILAREGTKYHGSILTIKKTSQPCHTMVYNAKGVFLLFNLLNLKYAVILAEMCLSGKTRTTT